MKPLKVIFLWTALIWGVSGSSALAQETPPYQEMQLTTLEGEPFKVLVAGPEDAGVGILMAHDWFGVSPFYKETVERLAGQGFRVVAIDYYNGESAETHQQAFTLMQKVDQAAVFSKIKSALSSLKSENRTLVTFGFSLGTEFVYRAALEDGDIQGVVLWYGFVPTSRDEVEGLNAEVLAVLGSLDGPAAETGAAFSQIMDEAGKLGGLYIYPGGHHAFAQPLFNAGATFDPKGASAAWAITLDFLENLKKD